MRQAITTFALLEAHKNSKKKYLFEVEPAVFLTGWIQHGTSTNCWSCVWAGGMFSDTGVIGVAADGTALTVRTSLSACNSNASSYYLDTTNSLLYVHAADSGTPASYTVVARFLQCFATHSGCVFTFSGGLHPVIYRAFLKTIPAFTARDDDIVDSGSSIAIGSLVMANGRSRDYAGGGPLDYSLKNYSYVRARCRCLIGGEDLPYSEYKNYWSGMVDNVQVSSSEATFTIKDSLQALDYKYPPDIYQLSRKALYEFDAGALTVDASGNSHTLTAIGDPAESTAGKFSGCVALDSDDAFSAVDHADFKPTVPFEVGAWVKRNGTSGNAYIAQSCSISAAPVCAGWWLFLSDATGYAAFVTGKNTGAIPGTDIGVINGAVDLCDNDWHLVVGAWNGTYLLLYVDGIPAATPVAWANAPVYAATNYVRIGCSNWAGSNSNFFTGSLDRVYITHERLQPGLEGATQPTIYGVCRNIKPAEINTLTWMFNCASHEVKKLVPVREAGIDITGNINWLGSDLANGSFMLSAYADGKTITCDVEGAYPDAELISTYGGIALVLLQAAPGLQAADIDSTAFTDFEDTCPQTLGVYCSPARPLREILREMNTSVMCRIIKGRDGKLRPVKFALPALTADATFTTAIINNLSYRISQDKLYYRVKIGYEKNHTVQPDTAAGGSAIREDWSHSYKYAEAASAATKARYSCEDTLIVDTLLAYREDAEALAEEYLAMLGQPWLEIEFESPFAPYDLDVGDTIAIIDSRFYFSGWLFLVTGIDDDTATAKVRVSAKTPCDGVFTTDSIKTRRSDRVVVGGYTALPTSGTVSAFDSSWALTAGELANSWTWPAITDATAKAALAEGDLVYFSGALASDYPDVYYVSKGDHDYLWNRSHTVQTPFVTGSDSHAGTAHRLRTKGFVSIAATQMIASNTSLERVGFYCAESFQFTSITVSVWRMGAGIAGTWTKVGSSTATPASGSAPYSATAGINVDLVLATPIAALPGDFVGLTPVGHTRYGFICNTYSENKNVLGIIAADGNSIEGVSTTLGAIRMKFWGQAPNFVVFGETDPTGLIVDTTGITYKAYPVLGGGGEGPDPTAAGVNDGIDLTVQPDYSYTPGAIIAARFGWSWLAMGSWYEMYSMDLNARYLADIVDRAAPYAMIQFGRHDVTKASLTEALALIERIIKAISPATIPIVVTIPPIDVDGTYYTANAEECIYRRTAIYNYNAALMALAPAYPKAVFVDISSALGAFVADAENGDYYHLDAANASAAGTHLNYTGYTVMANYIADILEDGGSI